MLDEMCSSEIDTLTMAAGERMQVRHEVMHM